ncbi:signal peptidase I [Streptomyces sp. P1-3]|uniref:signal peptidase I n=1 Tax=Streptomyces sp. P1-3 TaxID=3421658 RepID=UPI003D36CFA9
MGSRGRPRHGQRRAGGGAHSAGAERPGERVPGGRAERRKALRRIKRRRRRSAVKEIPILIGVALLIALVLKTFLVQAFVIPSGSMEQTIRIGDRVLVDKLTPWFGSKPERGDVVVFKDPGDWLKEERKPPADDPVVIKQAKQFLTFIGLLPSDDEQDLIKRVVAVGGDTVQCCDKDGRVTVNGTPLNEPYLHPGNEPSKIRFKVKVPKGRLFMMGDHRADSADSRFHLDEEGHGTVSEDLVVGRAIVIAWPFGHWRRLEEPSTYASVKDAPSGEQQADGSAHRLAPTDQHGMVQLPTPAELPLVMGVVGLRRTWRRRQRGVRSRCGGCGGRRTVRPRRARQAVRDDRGTARRRGGRLRRDAHGSCRGGGRAGRDAGGRHPARGLRDRRRHR